MRLSSKSSSGSFSRQRALRDALDTCFIGPHLNGLFFADQVAQVRSDALEKFVNETSRRYAEFSTKESELTAQLQSTIRAVQFGETSSAELAEIEYDAEMDKARLHRRMLFEVDGIIQTPEGIDSDESLATAQNREGALIRTLIERQAFYAKQAIDSAHPRDPLVTRPTYQGACALIAALVLGLNWLLARHLSLTQAELGLLCITDICCVILLSLGRAQGMPLMPPAVPKTTPKSEDVYASEAVAITS